MAKVTVQLASPPTKIAHEITREQNGKAHLADSNGHSSQQIPQVTYSVIHAIRGRVRFHVPRLRHDTDYAHVQGFGYLFQQQF
jgi:P-type Cu2+ transporter